jgi:hypothetical protein
VCPIPFHDDLVPCLGSGVWARGIGILWVWNPQIVGGFHLCQQVQLTTVVEKEVMVKVVVVAVVALGVAHFARFHRALVKF